MARIAEPRDYWIAPNAIYITRNALGDSDRIQGNVAAGAAILCYMKGVEGLEYDNGHNYKSWPLSLSPTYFNTTTPKYIYAAIPKTAQVGTQAIIVFPSQKLDVYGMAEPTVGPETEEETPGEQIGSTDYYYIWLQGILSASVDELGATQEREWLQEIQTGLLSSDEALAALDTDWYSYSQVTQKVTFLKRIVMGLQSAFESLRIGDAELTGVAKSGVTDLGSESDIVTPAYVEDNYLSKKHNDTAEGNITFRKGFQSPNFREGDIMGAGFGATLDENGVSKIEVDKLIVRMKAFFAELEIREVSYLGGNYVFSAAGSRIYYVEWLDSEGDVLDKETAATNIAQFRCFLYSDDGTTATINKWAIDDQARCQTFNIDSGVHQNVTNKFYWRRVSSIGKMAIPSKENDLTSYQYIVFDNTENDCASGSDIPEAGDAIAQMGNWTNRSRQGIIYLDLEGTNAPAIMEYSGVGEQHFVLPDPTLMLSPKKNVIYGEFHSVVDGQTNPDTIDDQLQDLIDALNDVKSQSDQKFDVWFGSGKPLPSKDAPDAEPNYPAVDWTTEELKALHVQDIYYDTTREPAAQGGRAWRWIAAPSGATYYWEDITDSDTVAALEKISDVASDGKLTGGAEKVRVYIDWMRCVREYREYTELAEDYNVPTTDYIAAFLALFNLLNGTELTELPNPIPTPAWLTDLSTTTIIPSPSDYRAAWDGYYNTLAALLAAVNDATFAAAEQAQQTADAAQAIIDDIVADGVLDPSEKQTIKREFVASLHEMIDTNDSVDRPGLPAGIIDRAKNDEGQWIVSYNDYVKPYEDAFTALGTYLNGGVAWTIPSLTAFVDASLNVIDSVLPSWIQEANMSVMQEIESETFRKKWSDFFSARTSLLTALTKNAQQTADDAQQDIDTIASDSILSRVEKKEVRKEWEALIRTRAQNIALATAVNLSALPSSAEGGYGEGGAAILNTYNTTFTSLGKYMNGDYEEGASSSWDATTIPAWISDAQMDIDQPIVPTTYRSYWYAYYEAEIKVLNAIAAMTKSESERALQAIADIAADGIVTPSEKETLILQWNAVISELPPLLIQADANRDASSKTSTAEKQQVTALRTAYVNAFQNLADYMNGGETYTWQYTSPQNFPTLAWFDAENKGRNETVAAAAFTGLWSTYFDTRNALQKYIIDISRRPGDDALDELYDLASDGKLTAAEKLTVKREWLAINNEYEDLQVKARQCHASVDGVRMAYNVLSNYLDDLTTEAADSSDYINVYEGEIVVPRDIDDPTTSDVNASLFNSRWADYYAARTALLALMASAKTSWFVGVDVPTPPYKVGDLWMKLTAATDTTGVMMICIQSRDTAPGQITDWTPYSNVATDISLLMSALVIKAYQYVAEAVEGGHTVRVRLGTAAAADYDLAYYNGEVAWWVPGRSNTITDDRLQTAMANLMEVIGRKDFRIVAQKNALVAPAQYDIVAKPITFTDPNLPVGSEYRTVKGGLEILMYDGRQWIVLQESTRNLMESLPGYMRFVVFGSANGTIESSGIMLQQDFATMFSEAVDDDTNIVKRAEIGTFVTKDPDTGELESGVKIGGDQIIMEGKTIINNKFVVADDGSVILTDLTVNGNSSFAGDVFLSGSKGLSLRGTTGDENVRIKAENIDDSDVYLSQSFHSEEQTATVQRTDATASSQTLYGGALTVLLNGDNVIKAGAKVQMSVMIHGAMTPSAYINPSAADITVGYAIMQGTTTQYRSSVVLSSQVMSLLYFPVSIPEYTIPADGNYSLCIESIALSNITSQCSLYNYTGSVTTVFTARHNIVHVPRTVIGQNGIAVSAGLNKWLFASSDQIVARFGNSGIRMNDNGMQKLVVTSEGLEVWINEAGVRRSVSGTYTAKTEDTLLLCETGSGDVTVNLTSKAQYEGHIIRMRRSSPNGNVNVRSEFTKIYPAGGTGLVESITISDNKMHSFLFSGRWYEI